MSQNYSKSNSDRYSKVMDSRRRLVDKIIVNMKNGYILPKPLWDASKYKIHNPVSGALYKGSNAVRLLIETEIRGCQDPRWMTLKQANAQGYKIKSGAKGVQLEKFVFEVPKYVENETTGEQERIMVKLERPIINLFTVYNATDIEGLPPLNMEQKTATHEGYNLADKLIESSKCDIQELPQSRAYYRPTTDSITLPLRSTFNSPEAFTSVLMHEMIHSTGHQSRLNRSLVGTFGSPEYAKEELRAELGSFFMGTDLGIEESQSLLDSHTHYLESWIQVLEDDPNELFRACNDAQKAVELLENNLENAMERQVLMQKVVREDKQADAAIKAEQSIVIASQVPITDEVSTESNIEIQSIFCKGSPNIYFQCDKEYSVAEFDQRYRKANILFREKQLEAIEKYGSLENFLKSNELDEYVMYRDQDSVDFSIRYRDGSMQDEELVIDGKYDSAIDCLEHTGKADIAKQLKITAVKDMKEHPITEGMIRPHLPSDSKELLNSIQVNKLDVNGYLHFSIQTRKGEVVNGRYRTIDNIDGRANQIATLPGLTEHPELALYHQNICDRLSELVSYPEPVVQILQSQYQHPMLVPGNQLTFDIANQLFGSLNKQREIEVYMSDNVKDPLFYPIDYRLIYQYEGQITSINDTYDIGADEANLLEHIMLSPDKIHDASVCLGVHDVLRQQQTKIEEQICDIKEKVDEISLSEKILHKDANIEYLDKANGLLKQHASELHTIHDSKEMLATDQSSSTIMEQTKAYMEQIEITDEVIVMEG